MRIAERKRRDLALDVGAVTDADDIQLRVNPVDTPCTAFAASARVSPCSAACSSPSRSIFELPVLLFDT